MSLPILYKYTQKGQVQQWQIFVSGDSFYTEEGIQGGTITRSKPTICKSKNVGRSNETTPEKQAEMEAQSKWQKKLDGGYNEKLTKDKRFFEPMLAHDLAKYEKLLFTVPTYIQPKLDGVRVISEKNSLTSRNGKAYRAAPHLYQERYLLDGELYNHDYADNFNKIISLVKKQSPTEDQLKESAKLIQFWAYDLPSYPGHFSQRYAQLKMIIKEDKTLNGYMLVPTYKVESQAEVDKYHEQFLSEGYEGSILRLDLGSYENKRSKQLLKKKDFIDEEFKILSVHEGEGGRAGTVGYFVMQLDRTDKTFRSNIKGDFEYLAEIWKDKAKYVGKSATVKYFNRTPDNVPRFPYVIKISREDYE